MQLGNILKLIRTKRGYNQKSLAEEIGITQNYLSMIESSKKQPSVELINKISASLAISSNALLIAASNIPCELSSDDQEKFRQLQKNLISILLFD